MRIELPVCICGRLSGLAFRLSIPFRYAQTDAASELVAIPTSGGAAEFSGKQFQRFAVTVAGLSTTVSMLWREAERWCFCFENPTRREVRNHFAFCQTDSETV